MNKPHDDQKQKPGQVPAPVHEDAKESRAKAEEAEVAGRHDNIGPKDHKGAR